VLLRPAASDLNSRRGRTEAIEVLADEVFLRFHATIHDPGRDFWSAHAST
jgi:hypothetical protein